jgi:hypothetical protein
MNFRPLYDWGIIKLYIHFSPLAKGRAGKGKKPVKMRGMGRVLSPQKQGVQIQEGPTGCLPKISLSHVKRGH